MAKPRITVFQCDPEVPLCRYDQWLQDQGLRITLIQLWEKDVPPLETLGNGILVLGGRMDCHAASEHRWIEPIKDLIADACETGLPVVGICLGHQLIAEALGGEVTVSHPNGREGGPAELEWLPGATDDPVLGELARQGLRTVPISHKDVVTALPPGAIELARTDRYPHQAFRLGSALGMQFHPEADPALMEHWSRDRGEDAAQMRNAMEAVDTQVVATCRPLAAQLAAAYAG